MNWFFNLNSSLCCKVWLDYKMIKLVDPFALYRGKQGIMIALKKINIACDLFGTSYSIFFLCTVHIIIISLHFFWVFSPIHCLKSMQCQWFLFLFEHMIICKNALLRSVKSQNNKLITSKCSGLTILSINVQAVALLQNAFIQRLCRTVCCVSRGSWLYLTWHFQHFSTAAIPREKMKKKHTGIV